MQHPSPNRPNPKGKAPRVRPLAIIAKAFGMTDEAWRRHANPWSVYTRFAAIPAMILAIWSRVWLGWWALLPLALVIAWRAINPHVVAPIDTPRSWAAKGIYGERLWLERPDLMPPGDRLAFRWLAVSGLVGAALLGWGLVVLEIWPTVFGASLVVMAQLWRIDRLGRGIGGRAGGKPCCGDVRSDQSGKRGYFT